MTRNPLTAAPAIVLAALLAGGLAACGDGEAAASGEGCTDFVGQEETIGIRHGLGLEPDGPVREAEGAGSTPLGDLVVPGDGEETVLTVFDSRWTGEDIGLSANAAISGQVQRTGSGPYNDPMKPLETTEVEVAGMPAYRATLTTTDGVVYTAWMIPGEQRSLDIVLAQSAAADEDLAARVPDLVEAGGCASAGSRPRGTASPDSPSPSATSTRCVDLSYGGQDLALEVPEDLQVVEPGPDDLPADYSAGDGITVERLTRLLQGAGSTAQAEGLLAVYATQDTPRFPASEALQRTISEAGGPMLDPAHLQLGESELAGRPATTASHTNAAGDVDAWTFVEGDVRFVVVAQQLPDADDDLDLSETIPAMMAPGTCDEG